ncbi:MAG: AAA family ATPase [Thermoleophilaceae bacterium]
MSSRPGQRPPAQRPIKRRDVYPGPVVDGREMSQRLPSRLRSRWQGLMVSRGEREEADVEGRIRSVPGVTRANTVAMISPKGGVGKTTSSFVVGNLLSNHLRLRTIVVDANPDFGTLAALAPDRLRPERNLADLINDLERVHTAAELGPYVSRLPSGLHLLGAPTDAELMAKLGPEAYGHLLAFLSIFYEVILLDLGTGITDPLARFAVEALGPARAGHHARVHHLPERGRRAALPLPRARHAGAQPGLGERRGRHPPDRGPLPRAAPAPLGHHPARRSAAHHARHRHLRPRRAAPRHADADQAAGPGGGGAAGLMGTALRERPRVVAVQVIGLLALVAIGFVLGGALKSDPAPRTPAAVQQRVKELEKDKRTTSAALDRAEGTQTRQAKTNRALRRRVRSDTARIRRFRRALTRARRAR